MCSAATIRCHRCLVAEVGAAANGCHVGHMDVGLAGSHVHAAAGDAQWGGNVEHAATCVHVGRACLCGGHAGVAFTYAHVTLQRVT